MAEQLFSARQRVWQAWMSLQVEYQGSYSDQRLQQLGRYMREVSTRRLLLVCVLTPLPCLALSLVKEIPPLAPPEAGVYGNSVFFARSWAVMCFMGVAALLQMGHGAPKLRLSNMQIAFISLLAATVSILFIFGLCALTVFPLPFGLLIVGPPFVLTIGIGFTYISGPRWRADPSLFVEVQRQLVVYQCQTTLPFVYPLYILGFVSLTGWNQVIFVAVLPIIQIIAKNWISRALGDDDDQKPQCVIFVVEVYNALYVSNVLQTASSWASTAAVMVVDLVQFWVSMVDIVEIFESVNVLMAKIPRDHPLAQENFVQVAIRLLVLEAQSKTVKEQHKGVLVASLKCKPVDRLEGAVLLRTADYASKVKDDLLCRSNGHRWMLSERSRVIPVTRQTRHQSTASSHDLELETIFSRKERVQFIRKTKRVLFIAEYLVLVEYVEVVLPFVYCLHQLVLFHMHNGAYYPALANVSRVQFTTRLSSTLWYSVLQFASFVLLVLVLKRKLGYSSLQQLAFVLDVHAGVVQTKLNLIFVYIMQVSLGHLGADFSFKFSWLKSPPTDSN